MFVTGLALRPTSSNERALCKASFDSFRVRCAIAQHVKEYIIFIYFFVPLYISDV
jgi:hypothetical protein